MPGQITVMNTDGSNTASDQAVAWYLVQCKPRQDERAQEHLLRQGYHCYRPEHSCECVVRGRRQIKLQSLFPGYLFIALADDANWAPLRSTRGVTRVVGFGGLPVKVDAQLIAKLQQRAGQTPKPVLQEGENVRITDGSFAEVDAIYMAMDGDERVLLLLSLLNRQQQVSVPLASITKVL